MPPPKNKDHDDDDDDRPVPKKKKRETASSDGVTATPKKRPRRDEDDDDDDDRPVPKRKKPAAESSNKTLLIGGIVGGGLLLLMCCCGVGIGGYIFVSRKEAAVEVKAPLAGNDRPKGEKPNPGDRPPLDKIVPAKPVNLLAAPAVNVKVSDLDIKDVVFAEQASIVGLYYWEKNTLAKKVEYWDWKTPRRLGDVALSPQGDTYLNLSPMGTRLVAQRQFPAVLNIWSAPDGNKILQDWDPYAKTNPRNRVAWANFLDEDRLLIVTEKGQFDLWSISRQQLIYSKPAIFGGTFLHIAPFARAPQNFNLSPNRKLLAITNGAGFEFFDTATGNSVGKTESLGPKGKLGNIFGLAFDRTGSALAFKGTVNGVGPKKIGQDVIIVWDVPSGRKKWHYDIEPDFQATGPIVWHGPRHLAIHDGNCFKSYIFTLQDGRYQRECKSVGFGLHNRMARVPPDDRVWYVTTAGFSPLPKHIVAVPLPEDDIARNPSPEPRRITANLPVWLLSPDGILRK